MSGWLTTHKAIAKSCKIGLTSTFTFKAITTRLSHQMYPHFLQVVAKSLNYLNVTTFFQNRIHRSVHHSPGPAFLGHTVNKMLLLNCQFHFCRKSKYMWPYCYGRFFDWAFVLLASLSLYCEAKQIHSCCLFWSLLNSSHARVSSSKLYCMMDHVIQLLYMRLSKLFVKLWFWKILIFSPEWFQAKWSWVKIPTIAGLHNTTNRDAGFRKFPDFQEILPKKKILISGNFAL